MSPAASNPPSWRLLFELTKDTYKNLAFKAAIAFDLFTVIHHGHQSVPSIAQATHCHEHTMRVLLDALSGIGLVEKLPATYRLTPVAATYLVEESPYNMLPFWRHFQQKSEQLVDCIRLGTIPDALTAADSTEVWAAYAAGMSANVAVLAQANRERWQSLDLPYAADAELAILDAGCGAAIRSLAFAQDYPRTHVTLLDSAPVLAHAERTAKSLGVSHRVAYLAGSLLDTPLPVTTYDLILVVGVLKFFPVAQIQPMLSSLYHALKPNGVVILQDFMPDENRSTDQNIWGEAIELLTVAPQGDLYTFAEYQRMFISVGFHDIRRPHDLILTAHKPSDDSIAR